MYDGPLEVVLVDVGPSPQTVADVLKDEMSLSLADHNALADALPLTLFKNLERQDAEALRRQLELAGADVELRVPRERSKGLRRAGSSPLISS